MFRKSRKKIVAAIMSILVVLLIGTLGIIYVTSYADVYRKNQEMLERYVSEYSINGNPSEDAPLPGKIPHGQPDEDSRFILSVFYSVAFSKDDEVISIDNDGSGLLTDDSLVNLASELADKGSRIKGTAGKYVYLIDRNDSYTLVVLMDNTLISDSITTLFKYTMLYGGCLILVFFFMSFYLAKRIIQPLEENYQKQKQFISDAGHELKTPVSVVSANAEMLSREIGSNKWLDNIQFENSRMAALVNQLLILARTENTVPEVENIDFSRLVTGGTLPFESLAYERGLTLKCSVQEGIFLYGNADQLGQLISIFIDNAISHSKESGTVSVSLILEHGAAVFSVTNEGDEIAPEQREVIFERFYRGDDARTGEDGRYGLGLAIAKAVVHSHKGRIAVECSNGTTLFTAVIPVTRIKTD